MPVRTAPIPSNLPSVSKHPCQYCGRMIATTMIMRYPTACSANCQTYLIEARKRGEPTPLEVGDHPAAATARTVEQAAKRLGVNQQRVREIIKRGRLPALRLGRSWLIEEQAIANYKPLPVGRPSKRKL